MNVVIFLLCVLSVNQSLAEVLSGIAKNAHGNVVYTEKHTVEMDESGLNKFIRVEYSKPNGAPFATMTSDFSKDLNVPNTTFEDKRFNIRTTMRIVDGMVEFVETRNDKQILKKTIPREEAMVASQGFDNFIKLNALKLLGGPIEFKFGVLDKKGFYSLTGYRRSTKSPDEIEYGIRASRWLLRLFAQELRVVYDSKKMRLKLFAGRSNLVDDSERPQDVVISYEWSEHP